MNGKELYENASAGSGYKCSCDPMLDIIRELEKPTILEIGMSRGLGMWRMLTECPNIKRAFGIDPWCEDENRKQIVETRGVVDEWIGNKLTMIVDRAENAVDMFADETFDYIFIDGDHGYDACVRDIKCWWSKMKKGGVFAGHDYKENEPGVIKAVGEFADEYGLDIQKPGGWVWYVRT